MFVNWGGNMICYVELIDDRHNCKEFMNIIVKNRIGHKSIFGNNKKFELYIDSTENRRKVYECLEVKEFLIDRGRDKAI